jgi:hypothetical protein
MSAEAASTPKSGIDPLGRRLESWKEIATYLGRDVTTVHRWEKGEGLPVHRHLHNKLGSVCGYTTELDGWRSKRAPVPTTDALDTETRPDTDTGPITQPVPWWNYARTAPLAALALVLVAVSIYFVRELAKEQAASITIRSLAVLPLANFSGNSEQDYLSDGMTEALIAQLSAIRGLRVISRTSTMQFKGTEVRACHWEGTQC